MKKFIVTILALCSVFAAQAKSTAITVKTAIQQLNTEQGPAVYYDMLGRRVISTKGVTIQKRPDGTFRKIYKSNPRG